MGWIAKFLIGALLNVLGSMVGRVLTALGIGVLSYSGINTTIDWLKAGFVDSAMSLPSGVVGIMSMLKVGSCVNMVFSAMLVRMVLLGMQSGTVKSWVKK